MPLNARSRQEAELDILATATHTHANVVHSAPDTANNLLDGTLNLNLAVINLVNNQQDRLSLVFA